jgi:rhodanese-related sulfurtransferase
MKKLTQLFTRAIIIALTFTAIGVLANVAADDPVLWVYEPPKEIALDGVKISLIDEKEAMRFLDNPETVFVDSRNFKDYARSHVKGAVCLPPDDVEQRFPTVEPMIPIENRVILYCHGPECDMAEKVAVFLSQMGYGKLMIMNSGFPAWEKAKYPVEGATENGAAYEDYNDDGIFEEKASTIGIASADSYLKFGAHCNTVQ